ncbi:methionine adenosyltransferase [Nadsonia fulvescens var. elongata DSM 6958]|uniref:methionine adenosyltransferase n=1 Tax=Nadsonia fulvescens var. elongata DSM 6958 TaxID=857566 RepID=A0A1E3PFG4_9ASCO|nr:methionine adenosyltransferase [Nadsonia fulvescens var. elongata DSM 6958]
MIMVFGEITTKAVLDYQKIVRDTIKHIGYNDSEKGFDYKTCRLHFNQTLEDLGAGDQGIMFGYASDEPEELLPLTAILSHKLNAALATARRDGSLGWLRADTKTQVTVEYENDNGATVPIHVDTVVISTQHSEDISIEDLRAHGGGAFSGKDFSKVDRTAAYAARWVAKSLVNANLARRALVQFSYAIGVAEPLSIFVDTYGTSKYSSTVLVQIIRNFFDLRPGVIVKDLNLARPIYFKTASYGHFTNQENTWEQPRELKF